MKKVALSCLLALSLGLVLGITLSTGPVAADFSADLGTVTSAGIPCGTNTCTPGQFCCNRSCSICAPLGGFCTQQVCDPTE